MRSRIECRITFDAPWPTQLLPPPHRAPGPFRWARHAFSPARFAPLFREGEIRSLVEVEPDGMVDVAVQQLGARLAAVGVVIPPRN